MVMKSSIVWDITPCSPLKEEFSICFMLVSLLAYSSTRNMEATCFTEMSVDFQMTVNIIIIIETDFHEVRIDLLQSCALWLFGNSGGAISNPDVGNHYQVSGLAFLKNVP
jgi:hypothetical protein